MSMKCELFFFILDSRGDLHTTSNLGKEITGKRVKAFTIDQINPHDALGYRNIVVQVGINNLKNELFVSIENAFDEWLKKNY